LPGNILDLGCGNGNILRNLCAQKFSGMYMGVDFSPNLINDAQQLYATLQGKCLFKAQFSAFDLVASDWRSISTYKPWEVICAFAVFHHIPGSENRRILFQHVRKCMYPATKFIFSVWQPQNSTRLVKRFQSWNVIGMSESDVESGDVLLDWKSTTSTMDEVGYRYVHIFTPGELQLIATDLGFTILENFYSDGKEGNVGLYHVWQKNDD
ncbi:MAG TPA: hypothetical protein DCK95_03530, partial [Anaerolineaceae bacterium]|nr:hypothetical protein [Anaerolineaceae bacterium]